MPPVNIRPLINDRAYDISSIELTIATPKPVTIASFISLNYQAGLTPGMLRGNGPYVLQYSRGQFEASGSFTLARKVFDSLLDTLALCVTPDPKAGYMEKLFSFVVTYGEFGSKPTVDNLQFCRITSHSAANQTGGDPTAMEVEYLITKMRVNNHSPVRDRNGQ